MRKNTGGNFVIIQGKVKKDCVTKNLIHRLEKDDIAIINHKDLDQVVAQHIVERKVKAVINVDTSITGEYYNIGPSVLLQNDVFLYDKVGEELFSLICENETIEIVDNQLRLKDGRIYPLFPITKNIIEQRLKSAKINYKKQYLGFIKNTIRYLQKEYMNVLYKNEPSPKIQNLLCNQEVVVVVRGKDAKKDLKALRNYILVHKPVLVGIDGGADILLDCQLQPDILFGDMDSVTDKGICNSKYVVIHSYHNGRAPGLERVEKERLDYELYNGYGISEDAAMLMAYYAQVERIILIGSHNNMIDFLDKGRKGMASTVLIRMLVGEKLIDTKGIHLIMNGVNYNEGNHSRYTSI